MKKVLFRAEAVLLAVAVFFCSIVYKPIKVEAAALGGSIIQNILWSVGVGLVSDYAQNEISKALGWSDSDIKTDAEGNVIISESQIEDIKSAYEDAVLAPSGAYMYKGSPEMTYKEVLSNCCYSSYDNFIAGNPGSSYNYFWFSVTYPCQYWAPIDACFWVSPSNASGVDFYDANLNKIGVRAFRYNLWASPAWENYTDPGAPSGNVYYGEPHICFASLDDLTNYLGIEDTEKPFMVPGMNTEIDNSVTAYDSSIGDVVEIDFKYDKGDLVFTPEGYLYLNYTDIDQDGIPDDHDDDLPAPDVDVDTSGMKETILFEDTVNGWTSGNVQLSDDWTNYDFLSFTFSSVGDGGLSEGNTGASTTYVTSSDLLSTGSYIFAFYYKRGFHMVVNDEDYTTLYCSRRFADGESSSYIPVVYVIKGYNISSSGSSGGGSFLDLTKTNNFLASIDDSLNDILKWVKKIYNQVVLGNIIEGADLLNDLFQQELDDLSALGEIAQTKFPFSLAVDILAILTILEAEPQAPVFEIPFRDDFGGATGISVDEVFVLDFTMFEDAVEVLRWWLSIMWIFALVWMTPRFLDVGGDLTGGGKK